MEKINSITAAWRVMYEEHKQVELSDDQLDFVSAVVIDQISKIIAEHNKA